MPYIDANGNVVSVVPHRSTPAPANSARMMRRDIESQRFTTPSQDNDRCSCCAPRTWTVSPVFLGLLAGFATLATIVAFFPTVQAFFILATLVGWIISLALHEFGHAIVAYKGGDASVADKGYLTLDVREYVHPLMSIALPCLFLLLGGIALPGGAVYIQTSSLRSKWWDTYVSLAGPTADFLSGAICSFLLHVLIWIEGDEEIVPFASVRALLGLLAYFQVMSGFINLIPLPPLDGWGALSPHLSNSCFLNSWMQHQTYSQMVPFGTFVFIYFGLRYVPFFDRALVFITSDVLRVPLADLLLGLGLFFIKGNPFAA